MIHTLTEIKGGDERTTLGDKGKVFTDIILVLESHSDYPQSTVELRIDPGEQDHYWVGDLFEVTRDEDNPHSWEIKKVST